MDKEYKWKIGGYYDKADANLVGKEIDSLETINIDNIVEKAKDESTELNKLFEWDDTKAGIKYRKIQANNILQSIQVVIKKGDEVNEPKLSKAFVTLSNNTEYEPIEVVVCNPQKYNLLLERATEQLRKIRNNYSEVNELQKIFEMIDKL